MKRLTTEDCERMLRSRALPANFDARYALHGPFGTSRTDVPSVTPSQSDHLPTGRAPRRPLLDQSRFLPSSAVTQHGYPGTSDFAPAGGVGALAFTPPQSAGESAGGWSALVYQDSCEEISAEHVGSSGDVPSDSDRHLPQVGQTRPAGRPEFGRGVSPLQSSCTSSDFDSVGGHMPSWPGQAVPFPCESSVSTAVEEQARRSTDPPMPPLGFYAVDLSCRSLSGADMSHHRHSEVPSTTQEYYILHSQPTVHFGSAPTAYVPQQASMAMTAPMTRPPPHTSGQLSRSYTSAYTATQKQGRTRRQHMGQHGTEVMAGGRERWMTTSHVEQYRA